MELRKRVVPPKRYEPEISDGERYMPTARKALFRPPYVDFNPHLPPAAFPTLDEPVRTLSELDCGIELGERCQQPLPDQSESTTQDYASLQSAPPAAHPPTTSLVSMGNHTWNLGIHPHHPAYYRSLARLESGLIQEEHEWNMQDMETSDEDENHGQGKSALLKARQLQIRAPQWKGLAPVHRIEIIQGLLAEDKTEEQVIGILGLSAEEWLETVVWDHHRRKLERKEDSRIANMQHEMNQLLLDRNGMGLTNITSTTYQARLSYYLAAFTTGKMDFFTTTEGELVYAQNFLKSRGLPLSLLSRWVEPLVGAPKLTEENGSQITLGLDEEQDHATDVIGQESLWQNAARIKGTNTFGEALNVAKRKPPVRRKYVHVDDVTPSAPPKSVPTGQALKNTSSNVPFLKLNSRSRHQPYQVRPPGSIIANSKSETTQAPSKSAVVTSDASPVFEGLAQPNSLPNSTATLQADTVKDFDPTTIVVQPKRTWSGTAKPGRTTFFPNAALQTPAVGNSIHEMWKTAYGVPSVSRQSSEALERLRIESMKYSGKSMTDRSEKVKVKEASVPADFQNVAKDKNPEQLVVGVSQVSRTAPNERVRRASSTSSTTKGSTATAITPTVTPKDRSTPFTPDLPSSASATRSPMATRKPSRYRDSLTDASSPTDTITENRARSKQAVATRTETNHGYSRVNELSSRNKAANLHTDNTSEQKESALEPHTHRRSSLEQSERKQAVRRQSVQPILPEFISTSPPDSVQRNSTTESMDSIASNIEVSNNVVPGSGGKAPRKAPSKPLISEPVVAKEPAMSKVGGKAPRKGPSKPPSSGGKAPRKTASVPPLSELIAADDHPTEIIRETAKVKIVKPKTKRNKTLIGEMDPS
ncbi:Mucin-12 [Xylographa opegraphella]|nr:Mucin-12 [Xylographa opegraphella]